MNMTFGFLGGAFSARQIDWDDVWLALDTNHDGQLTFEEWIAFRLNHAERLLDLTTYKGIGPW
jgi:hypothetical protein